MNNPNMNDYSACNGACCGWYTLSCFGVQCVYQAIRRADKRERWGIDGSFFGDFCGACCCPCCGLAQEEKEALLRESGQDVKGKGYQAPNQMQY